MAAVMGRTELGIRQFGNTVTIPADPRAKLMYYLDCICVVLDMTETQNLARLKYSNSILKLHFPLLFIKYNFL